jgi:hypothetical protein
MRKTFSIKEITASLAGCAPEELINFRVVENGTAIAITPVGQKYRFTPEELAAKEAQMMAGRGESATRPLETATSPISGDPAPKLETESKPAGKKPVTKKSKSTSKKLTADS